jgi:uncharacterized protein (DUF433 family)
MLRDPTTYTTKEAALLANAFIASATASAPVSMRVLVSQEDRVLKSVEKATGSTVSEQTVNKAIEDAVIKPRLQKRTRTRRLVGDAAVFYLACFKMTDLPLPKSSKQGVYRQIKAWLQKRKHDEAVAQPVLKLAPHVVFQQGKEFNTWFSLLKDYDGTRSRNIAVDPDIMGGTPVIKGTRIPAHTINDLLERGASIASIRSDYPDLSEDAIVAAALYARAYPRIGRKKRFR